MVSTNKQISCQIWPPYKTKSSKKRLRKTFIKAVSLFTKI
ncbi:hypothetical protein ATCC51561_958 [Campylobacter concisus ATCC 51561]|nr:hypothetical protein ATCC51561_958 [Campylobacter concisus ATCC 51561]